MTNERLEYLNDGFLLRLVNAVQGFSGDYTNLTIDNLDRDYNEIVSFIINGDDEVDMDTEKLYQNKFIYSIRELADALCSTFNISVKCDVLHDVLNVFKLFMVRRYTTIAQVLLDQIETESVQLSEVKTISESIIKVAKRYELKDLMEDYYMKRLKMFHDVISFETPSQLFIDSFNINVDEIYNSDLLMKELNNLVIKEVIRNKAK